jgi:flagellar biogenesis protein FliO
MADDRHQQNSNFLAGVAFALLLALIIAGVWLFPRIYAFMNRQDCIASGRTNCVRYAPAGAGEQ